MKIAQDDYGGVTADEAVSRLIDEHWQRRAIAAVDRLRADDPDTYHDWLTELNEIAETDLGIAEPWEPEG